MKKHTEKINKAIIFDSGALISFTMTGLSYLIRDLKKVFDGKFLITAEVKEELVDNPIEKKRFKLEALKIKHLLEEGILEMPSSLGIEDSEISRKTKEVLNVANSSFVGNGKEIHLIDDGEASCLELSRILTEKGIGNIIAVDERTTRVLVENPSNLKKFLEKKLHTKIKINRKNLRIFRGFKIIRSPELIYMAHKKGFVKIKKDDELLDALLYAVKFKGASISDKEIKEIKKIARR